MIASVPAGVLPQTDEHELVRSFHDPCSGVAGFVAIHSTALGPAMGGLRIRGYRDSDAALADALRLSRAMTLKNAAAGLDLGGGKAVILDEGTWRRRADRLRYFGDVVEQLGGRYVTAEDVGTTARDMDVIGERTRWVAGRSREWGGRGDPSGSTARTVAAAIERAVALHLGTSSLEGVRVGVLGAGKVGGALTRLIAAAGGSVTVADVDGARAAACGAAPGVTAAPPAGFLQREFDVLAPCAFGDLIGVDEAKALRCAIVAGAANNVLVDHAAAVALAEREILYVPDFIANCGGIIHVGAEVLGLDDAEVERRLDACADRTTDILREALKHGELPLDVAERRALARVEAART